MIFLTNLMVAVDRQCQLVIRDAVRMVMDVEVTQMLNVVIGNNVVVRWCYNYLMMVTGFVGDVLSL